MRCWADGELTKLPEPRVGTVIYNRISHKIEIAAFALVKRIWLFVTCFLPPVFPLPYP